MVARCSDSRYGQLAEALASDDDAINEASRLVRAQVASYSLVSERQLQAGVRRTLDVAVSSLARAGEPFLTVLEEAQVATVERLEAGVPIEDIMAAFRINMSVIQDRMVSLAKDFKLSGDEVVMLTGLLWQLSDAFSARGVDAYRKYGFGAAVAEQRRRAEWLSGLLAGRLDRAELEHGVSVYGLTATAQYRAVCARGKAGSPESVIERLSHHVGTEFGLLAPDHGDVTGIVRHFPSSLSGCIVALGPPVGLTDVAASYAVAKNVLAAATMLHSNGIHSTESIGWRIGVPLVPDLQRLVEDRYLTPIRNMGPMADDVMKALRAYFEHNRNIPRTAEALHLHVNTLRYRLGRFEETTARSLLDTDTIIELSWALHLTASPS